MLETKGLIKVYKPKKGIPVKALDDVSIKFPEKGMVFLLGKSGSGKSTLLNVLGGLDRYDGGEIIIKGTSSRKFRQKHFDSYRNTYIGFIFQEYNILDEFSVGANIALALQLQGRKATSEEINRILDDVDLTGYGNRKPNELSGGQKQRVAIARALVKNPQIIMADEPTGALDSVTGKQVLDTLKKLSKEKLVIVVSHDRDFAENYADRIIELADGKVISDMEYSSDIGEEDTAESLSFEGNTVTIPEKYRLTEEDRKQINAYIEKLEKGEVTLTVSGKKEKKAEGRVSKPTDQSKITHKSGDFKLIKSRLPMRFAFKMGASSLKYKKVRLVFTILLSCVAFTLFGLADTFAAYDYVTTGTQSLIDSNVNYASFVKLAKYYYGNGSDDFYYTEDGHYVSSEDIERIFERTGVKLTGVYVPANIRDSRIYLDEWLGREDDDMGYGYFGQSVYSPFVRGFIEAELTSEMKLLAGKMPAANSDEIAITAYTLEIFKQKGFIPPVEEQEPKMAYYLEFGYTEYGDRIPIGLRDEKGSFYDIDDFDMSIFDEGYEFTGDAYYPRYDYKEPEAIKITKAEDMIGKEILGYKIVGVVDTGLDISRYEHIYEYDPSDSTADAILKYALQSEFENLVNYSAANVIFVGEGFVEAEMKKSEGFCAVNYGGEIVDVNNGWYINSLEIIAIADKVAPEKAVCINGKTPGTLSNDEILLPYRIVRDNYLYDIYYEWDKDGNMVEYYGGPVLVPASEFESVGVAPLTDEAVAYATLKLTERKISVRSYDYDKIGGGADREYTVVGFVMEDEGVSFYANENEAKRFATERDGEFVFAVGQMPTNRAAIKELVKLSDEEGDIRFEMKNPVLYELGILRDGFDIMAPIFMWIGVGFAVFASLMMSNFISTSITHKKREIGILRAIGSRSNDVFRIFFSESFVIAMINFVLTTLGVFAITVIANTVIRSQTGLLVTVLSFGIRQVVLELAVAVLVAFVASFLPVKRIASKKPIDAIRDR